MEGIIKTTSDIFTIHIANTGKEPVSIFENVAVARCESYDKTGASISNTFSCNRIDAWESRGLPEHLQDLLDRSSADLEKHQIDQLADVLLKYETCLRSQLTTLDTLT
ncbi:hypothetical protein DPMN_031343 [Dreissena polymorpha]|uniref:Uncharacterized protein n=1 Tax=Dreissena polymorpha TaxID=45954 RepID=A0A9D4M2E9_DREPO|nr:hypothetical protein DPMN_031343 [Dreissena polymorpha]